MARLRLEERLNRIEDKISEKSFRENKGLGNEVGYYVFDYDPRAELEVRNHIAYLKDRINNGNKDFKIIEFDLFHTMIQVLEEEGYLEAFFELEEENGFFDMAESIVETLGLDETNELNLIISKILQEDLTDSVVFLTGVGKCHPIIAAHNILNNLHQVFDKAPVVMFYPGEYSGQDLKLFGTIDSKNYWAGADSSAYPWSQWKAFIRSVSFYAGTVPGICNSIKGQPGRCTGTVQLFL